MELYTFNGCVGDTLIWVPSENERYLWNTAALYEYMPMDACIIPSGFAWCHFRALKLNISADHISDQYLIPIEKIRYTYKKDLMKQISVPRTHHYDVCRMLELHWESDKKNISSVFINNYLSKILNNFLK